MYLRAVLVRDKSADEMVRATRLPLGALPSSLRRTMTHDNGREFSGHADITAALGTVVYCGRTIPATAASTSS
jgi:IS30 family transposase